MTFLRRAAAAVLVTALAVVAVGVVAAPAEASTSAYRYWSYWYAGPSASSWTYGPVGPAGHAVVDGGVEGWRFVVAAPNPSAPQPRHAAAAAFHDVCGGTARPAGQVRVALVVDFGTSSDAPPRESPPAGVTGVCVVVPEGSRGLQVLDDPGAGYRPRTDSGLVCGLSGYPARECGVVVKKPSPSATPSPSKPRPSTSAAAPAPTRSPSPTASSASSAPSGSQGSGAATRAATPSGTPTASAPGGSATASPEVSGSGEPALAVGAPPPPTGGSGAGTPAGLLLGGALVLGLGAAAVLRSRSHHDPTGTA